jgi:hypothetical protein
MENPDLIEKHHGYPTAFSFTDLCAKLNEQRLDVIPLNVGAHWTAKNSF